jgi:preprotein translocase subunit SecD
MVSTLRRKSSTPVRGVLTAVAIAVVGQIASGCGAADSPAQSPSVGSAANGQPASDEITQFRFTAVAADGSEPTDEQLARTRAALQARFDAAGLSSVTVQQESDTIRFGVAQSEASRVSNLTRAGRFAMRPVLTSSVPGVSGTESKLPPTNDIDAAKAARQSLDDVVTARAVASLECAGVDPLSDRDDAALPLVTCAEDDSAVYALGPQELDMNAVSTATTSYDSLSASSTISVMFTPSADDVWRRVSVDNMGRQVAILLDGSVLSAPIVNDAAQPGFGISVAGFQEPAASDLATVLNSEPLPLLLAVTD